MSCGNTDLREYEQYVEALRARHPDVAAEVADFRGMGAVLEWLRRKGLDLRFLDAVVQDEFGYDLLLPLGDGRWLAFGVT